VYLDRACAKVCGNRWERKCDCSYVPESVSGGFKIHDKDMYRMYRTGIMVHDSRSCLGKYFFAGTGNSLHGCAGCDFGIDSDMGVFLL